MTEATLLTVDDEQLEAVQNDDIATIETDDEIYVLVRSEHSEAALEILTERDTPIEQREVIARD